MFAPNTDAITTQLTSDYAVNNFLMAWSHALLNTSLYPLDPKPSWFDRIDGELSAAQKVTQTWLNQDYPDIAAALPQSLITYSNAFKPAADEIVPLLAAKTLSEDDRATLVALFEELRKAARTQHWRVLGLQKKVTTFSAVVSDTAQKMSKDARDVIDSISASRKEVLALQARIGDLQQKLGATTADAKSAMTTAATTGASLTMTLMAFTISAGVGAAAFPVFGLIGAFIGIGLNAAKEAAKSEEVRQAIREIGELRVKLNAEQSQAAAMQSLAASLENLSDVVSASLTNMAGIVHHWDDICANLDLALEILDQPAVDLSALTPFTKIREAAAGWKAIAGHARKVQESVLKVESSPLTIVGEAA